MIFLPTIFWSVILQGSYDIIKKGIKESRYIKIKLNRVYFDRFEFSSLQKNLHIISAVVAESCVPDCVEVERIVMLTKYSS